MVSAGLFGLLSLDDYEPPKFMDGYLTKLAIIFTFLSFISGIFVTVSYIMFKNLRSHPSLIVVFISICESSASFHAIISFFKVTDIVELLKLDYVAYYSTFGMDLRRHTNWINVDYSKLERDAELLCEANSMLLNGFSLGSILFNIFLCVDLLLSLHNPFSPPHRRNKFFIGITITLVVTILIIFRDILKAPCRKWVGDEFQFRSTYYFS